MAQRQPLIEVCAARALLLSTQSSPAPGGSVRGGLAAALWRCQEAALSTLLVPATTANTEEAP